ncbi:MAG TPA: TadE family protein [Armatimonadota bacterium]|nr:TadE family protein [Armatimonadota bacterium]
MKLHRFGKRGQAILELALSITVLLLLALGAVQFGTLYSLKLRLEQAAREGARFAAAHVIENRDPDIIQHTRDASGELASDIEVQIATPEQRADDKPVEITVTYAYTPTVPLVKDILPLQGGKFLLRARAVMRIEG